MVGFVRAVKAAIVVGVAMAAIHASLLTLGVVLLTWLVLTSVEDYYTHKERISAIENAFEYEMFDWKPDPDDVTVEVKGEITRAKLPEHYQAVVARVGHLNRLIAIAIAKTT